MYGANMWMFQSEFRVDPADGQSYQFNSFLDFYGKDEGAHRWKNAKHAGTCVHSRCFCWSGLRQEQLSRVHLGLSTWLCCVIHCHSKFIWSKLLGYGRASLRPHEQKHLNIGHLGLSSRGHLTVALPLLNDLCFLFFLFLRRWSWSARDGSSASTRCWWRWSCYRRGYVYFWRKCHLGIQCARGGIWKESVE